MKRKSVAEICIPCIPAFVVCYALLCYYGRNWLSVPWERLGVILGHEKGEFYALFCVACFVGLIGGIIGGSFGLFKAVTTGVRGRPIMLAFCMGFQMGFSAGFALSIMVGLDLILGQERRKALLEEVGILSLAMYGVGMPILSALGGLVVGNIVLSVREG